MCLLAHPPPILLLLREALNLGELLLINWISVDQLGRRFIVVYCCWSWRRRRRLTCMCVQSAEAPVSQPASQPEVNELFSLYNISPWKERETTASQPVVSPKMNSNATPGCDFFTHSTGWGGGLFGSSSSVWTDDSIEVNTKWVKCLYRHI